MLLCLAVILPILVGLLLLILRPKSRVLRESVMMAGVLATSAIVFYAILTQQTGYTVFFMLTHTMPIAFQIDGIGTVFTVIVALLWPLATLYGTEYMEHEGGEHHFFAVYTMTYGITLGVAMAADVMTLYIFYEFLTLATIPLVMHGSRKDNISAGYTYMRYSFFGAAVAFVGVMLAYVYCDGAPFAMNGMFGAEVASAHPVVMQLGYLCMFIGFGVKAAVWPMHAWLPKASVAPTPVTALLHAVAVVKSGVFGIVRAIYYVYGVAALRNTPAQYITIALASITIIYGSSMAVREHHFKRRLAYSTISNLSYIVLAAGLMTQAGLTAAMAHMTFHALIKITLFFTAGAVLVRTGRSRVEELRGLGNAMPVVCAVYTLAAIALSGIPFLPGFISKWMIGTAAVEHGGLWGYIGVAAVLISAVLTAIYLLSVAVSMYFNKFEPNEKLPAGRSADPTWRMKVPLIVLSVLIIVVSFYSGDVVNFLTIATAGVL